MNEYKEGRGDYYRREGMYDWTDKEAGVHQERLRIKDALRPLWGRIIDAGLDRDIARALNPERQL